MNREEIQNLINDAAKAGRREVLVEAGTHVLDAPLALFSGLTLRGVSGQAILKTENKDITFIRLVGESTAVELNLDASDRRHQNRRAIVDESRVDDSGPHSIEISDLILQGPGTNREDITADASSKETKGCGILAYVNQSPAGRQEIRDILIQRCRLENLSGSGIRFDTRQDVPIERITIRDCQLLNNRRPADPPPPPGSGLPSPDSYKDIIFYGVEFGDILVENNTCAFTPTATSRYGNDSGIAVVQNGQREGELRNSVFRGNTCSGHRRHGIATNYGDLVPLNVEASGNTCHDNRWVGLYVQTNPVRLNQDNVFLVDNTCNNNGYGGLKRAPGTSVMDDADKSIRGGIVLNFCYKSRVTRNRCRDNGTPGSGFEGVDDSKQFASGIRVRGIDVRMEANVVQGNQQPDINKGWLLDEPGKNLNDTLVITDVVQPRTGVVVSLPVVGEAPTAPTTITTPPITTNATTTQRTTVTTTTKRLGFFGRILKSLGLK